MINTKKQPQPSPSSSSLSSSTATSRLPSPIQTPLLSPKISQQNSPLSTTHQQSSPPISPEPLSHSFSPKQSLDDFVFNKQTEASSEKDIYHDTKVDEYFKAKKVEEEKRIYSSKEIIIDVSEDDKDLETDSSTSLSDRELLSHTKKRHKVVSSDEEPSKIIKTG